MGELGNRSAELLRHYHQSIVRVIDANGVVHGAGFIVAPTLVITCTHVVVDALRNKAQSREGRQTEGRIQLQRPYGENNETQKAYFARVKNFHDWDAATPAQDLALLELIDDHFDQSTPPPKIGVLDDFRDAKVYIRGFPSGTRSASATYLLGTPQENGWIDATGRMSFGQEIRPGFSGAPVWHETQQVVVGILTEADPQRRTAVIIPAVRFRYLVPNVNLVDLHSATSPIVSLSATPPGLLRHCLDTIAPRIHGKLTSIGVFSQPADSKSLGAYVRSAKTNLGEIVTDKSHVPLLARRLGSLRVSARKSQSFASPIQQIVREIVSGSTESEGRAGNTLSGLRTSRLVRNLLRRLLSTREPLVLLGDPGSGKSLTLQSACLLLAEREHRRVFPTIGVFVRLGGFHVSTEPTEDDVLDFVRRQLDPRIAPYFDSLEQQRRLVIFFDEMDEMSKERYNEHTLALSKFAESHNDFVRTIFSCRIADFSPRFKHGRLALLPFTRSQIKAYLAKQADALESLKIGGERINVGQLTRELTEREFPIQVENPFVLYLLCYYLQEHESWPTSRVELLGFYFERNYDRKMEEFLLLGEEVPERTRIFSAWGMLAYLITCENRGSSISLDVIQAGLSDEDLFQILHTGVRCGVLEESLVMPNHFRFAHHRYQEYFAALYMWENEQKDHTTVWTREQAVQRFEVPRWQETVFNLVLLGGGAEPIRALVHALHDVAARRAMNADLVQELALAERVDLAARLLKHSGSSGEADRAELEKAAMGAIYHLVSRGQPVSQVEALQSAAAIPGVDLLKLAEGPLAGKNDWVRERTLITLQLASGERVHGESAFARRCVFAAASGNFLAQAPSLFRVAWAARSFKAIAAAVYGLAVALLGTGLAMGFAMLLAILLPRLVQPTINNIESHKDHIGLRQKVARSLPWFATDDSAQEMPAPSQAMPILKLANQWYSQPGVLIGVACLIVVAGVASATWNEVLPWRATFGTSELCEGLLLVAAALWQGGITAWIGFLTVTLAVGACGLLLADLLCTVWRRITLVALVYGYAYLFSTKDLARSWKRMAIVEDIKRQQPRLEIIYLGAISGCTSVIFLHAAGMRLPLLTDALEYLVLIAFVVYLGALAVIAAVGFCRGAIEFLKSVVLHPKSVLLNVLDDCKSAPLEVMDNCKSVLLNVLDALKPLGHVRRPKLSDFRTLVALLAACAVGPLVYLVTFAWSWLERYVAVVLLLFILLVPVMGSIWLSYKLLRQLAQRFRPPSVPGSAEQWRDRIGFLPSMHQRHWLKTTDAETIALTQRQFFELLTRLTDVIVAEPAFTEWQIKLSEVRQLARHEREE